MVLEKTLPTLRNSCPATASLHSMLHPTWLTCEADPVAVSAMQKSAEGSATSSPPGSSGWKASEAARPAVGMDSSWRRPARRSNTLGRARVYGLREVWASLGESLGT